MYPDFHYLFRSLFGVDIPGLAVIKTFGFWVAIAFLAGAWVLQSELKRKKTEGLFQPEKGYEIIGEAPTAKELITLFVVGFLIGFKLIGLFTLHDVNTADPAAYIFSMRGDWLSGLVLGAVLAFIRYRDKKKHQKAKPEKKALEIYPHQRVADIIFIAAIAGFAGAKIFNAFETWDDFVHDPIGNLFSPSGLTFYGGLICATAALFWYSRKKKFSFRKLCDAAAPALILAYGIGRLGCFTAGDGDWGIYNSAYLTTVNQEATLVKGAPQDFQNAVDSFPNAFIEFGNPPEVPHKYFAAPSWMPVWMVAQNFKNNVNNAGIAIPGDMGEYNHVLPVSVFPTPLYEVVACLIIFLILWKIRRRFKYPLQLFGIYLIFNGLERFLVETIRVNYKYDWGFIHPTQAEIISTCLIIAGVLLYAYVTKRGKALASSS